MPRKKTRVEPQSQTVDRAMQVLKMIAAARESMSVTEIAERLGVYPSVASRLVTTLEYHRMLRQVPSTRKYWLGIGLVELGTVALGAIELAQVARPALRELNAATGETVFLMVLEDGEGVYVAKIGSQQPIAIQSDVGHREPVHSSAVGKALLAYLPEEEAERIAAQVGLARLTPNTITDLGELKKELAEVRKQGYAVDNEEGESGIRCIGAPIFDHTNRPIASISVSAPAFRTPLEKLVGWKDAVIAASRSISQEFGHRA